MSEQCKETIKVLEKQKRASWMNEEEVRAMEWMIKFIEKVGQE